MYAYTSTHICHTTRRDPPGAAGAEQFVHEQHCLAHNPVVQTLAKLGDQTSIKARLLLGMVKFSEKKVTRQNRQQLPSKEEKLVQPILKIYGDEMTRSNKPGTENAKKLLNSQMM